MIYYTADDHFGHHNIIKYTNRYKFVQTVEEMDAMLVERWNLVVNPDDIVIHCGDVYFKNWAPLELLNGKKHLILGNHDQNNRSRLNYYFSLYDKDIVIDHEHKTVMSHYPIKDWPHKFQGYLHLHGHSHGTVQGYDPKAIDVGVDCWDFYPVTLDQIKDKVL